ncbi:MAG: T9SS type A sorting domain-containing protein [Bacteroidetes bacterium]|nr:T9SS type A sorting domain-containing protein [Bacteroidota bacterium]
MIHIQHDEKLSGIQIFDMLGKLVINQKCHGETETNIDLSHLPNGVYHVKAAGYQSVKVVKND